MVRLRIRGIVHLPWNRQPELFDDRFYKAVANAIAEIVGVEPSKEVTDEILSGALDVVLAKFTAQVQFHVRRYQRKNIRRFGRADKSFERRLRGHWGSALDQYKIISAGLRELGSEFNGFQRPAAVESQDFVFEALTGLHARACRTAEEVYHLLSGGFPKGALARCRTLHELAVTSGIICAYGHDSNYADLAERYLLHDHILNWKDALDYQEHCREIGYEPFSEAEMQEFEATRNAVIERLGRSFGMENGWATELAARLAIEGDPRPTFKNLEAIANLSHLRSYYKLASHEVHSDAKGWRLNVGQRGDVTYLSAGRMNFGLADPGQLALHSLQLCTTHLLFCAGSPRPADLVCVKAIQGLVDRVDEDFAAAEQSVYAAEEKIQSELKSKGKRQTTARILFSW